jgi:hypothetical protein
LEISFEDWFQDELEHTLNYAVANCGDREDADFIAPVPGESPYLHFSFDTIKRRVEGSISGCFDFIRESYTLRLAGTIR